MSGPYLIADDAGRTSSGYAVVTRDPRGTKGERDLDQEGSVDDVEGRRACRDRGVDNACERGAIDSDDQRGNASHHVAKTSRRPETMSNPRARCPFGSGHLFPRPPP